MPVFTTKGVTLTWESGEFDCPACGAPEVFWHRSVRRFLAVGPLPVVPLNRVADFIECQQCGHRYGPEVLDVDPTLRHELARLEFAQHVVWVMVLAGTSTTGLNEAQIASIQDVYEKLSGSRMGPEEVRREVEVAARSSLTPMHYVARFIEVFQERGRDQLLLRAVERIVAPDGPAEGRGRELLEDLRMTLGSGEVPAVRCAGTTNA